MTPVKVHRKSVPTTISVDQLWAGIAPDAKCVCGHDASDHMVKLRKTTPSSYRCEANCPCRTWDDGFGKTASL